MRNTFFGFFLLLYWVTLLHADGFVCAGFGEDTEPTAPLATAKPVQHLHEGTRYALLLFAQFRDEEPGWQQIPEWSQDIFDPEKPGSFSHFYDTMSFGKLQVRGEVTSRRYVASREASYYLAERSTERGRYGEFVLDILRQVDVDINFAHFDNDGPDGQPNSGDDDGVVDALFIVVASTPANFLLGGATGMADLNFGSAQFQEAADVNGRHFISGDAGVSGQPILVSSLKGTIQQGQTYRLPEKEMGLWAVFPYVSSHLILLITRLA